MRSTGMVYKSLILVDFRVVVAHTVRMGNHPVTIYRVLDKIIVGAGDYRESDEELSVDEAEAVIADLQEIIDSIRRGEPDPDPPKPVRQKRPSEMSPIERMCYETQAWYAREAIDRILDDADKMDKLWKNLSR